MYYISGKNIMEYRDHRGTLAEALETVIEINSEQDLIDHLDDIYKPFGYTIEEIKFTSQGRDERIGWDSHIVQQRLKGQDFFTVAGFSDGKF